MATWYTLHDFDSSCLPTFVHDLCAPLFFLISNPTIITDYFYIFFSFSSFPSNWWRTWLSDYISSSHLELCVCVCVIFLNLWMKNKLSVHVCVVCVDVSMWLVTAIQRPSLVGGFSLTAQTRKVSWSFSNRVNDSPSHCSESCVVYKSLHHDGLLIIAPTTTRLFRSISHLPSKFSDFMKS